MPREAQKYLYDVREAATNIEAFTQGKSFDDFREDLLLRSAVERQFEIIGEALSQLGKVDRETVAKVPEHRRIIAFRNVLIHGYANIDERLVWGIVESKLSELRRAVNRLLAQDEDRPRTDDS